MKNFGMIGAAGFVAPRHIKAISDCGCNLALAYDIADSVGILDRYFYDAGFFADFDRFDAAFSEMQQSASKIDYMSICTPNHLHCRYIEYALTHNADVVCEKPLVLNVAELDRIAELERATGHRVYTIMQLRLHPTISALKSRVESEPDRRFRVDLTYIAPRGKWYAASWKGDAARSGGLAMNIGIHLFDMLQWIFGDVEQSSVISATPDTIEAVLHLAQAEARILLSTDRHRLPASQKDRHAGLRLMTVDGENIDFTGGFEQLHTECYRRILDSNGFGIADARKAIELVGKLFG